MCFLFHQPLANLFFNFHWILALEPNYHWVQFGSKNKTNSTFTENVFKVFHWLKTQFKKKTELILLWCGCDGLFHLK